MIAIYKVGFSANVDAPSRLDGAPDDVRQFVDIAHSLGLGVKERATGHSVA
jgi:hypothetical protein